MKQVYESIYELLFKYDCVTLPGLGAFICNYNSAKLSNDERCIVAPTKTIIFNKNIINNDGLLAQKLSHKKGISFKKAQKLIVLYSEEIKSKLYRGEVVKIDNVGFLSITNNDNIHFESAGNNFLINSFCYDNLEISPIKSQIALGGGKKYLKNVRYAIAVCIVLGFVAIAHTIFSETKYKDLNWINPSMTSLKPEIPFYPKTNVKDKCHEIISPDYDYLDYDPSSDLISK